MIYDISFYTYSQNYNTLDIDTQGKAGTINWGRDLIMNKWGSWSAKVSEVPVKWPWNLWIEGPPVMLVG